MEIRKLQRPAICRGCNTDLKVGDDIFYTYSSANRGQNILFCMFCIDEITKMYDRYKIDED